jgi:hypothetical protein
MQNVRIQTLFPMPTLILCSESNVCGSKREFDFQAINQSVFDSYKNREQFDGLTWSIRGISGILYIAVSTTF